jgi:hypothetical protein
MDSAARNSHLDIVKYLYKNRTEGCFGHLDVVKYLQRFF